MKKLVCPRSNVYQNICEVCPDNPCQAVQDFGKVVMFNQSDANAWYQRNLNDFELNDISMLMLTRHIASLASVLEIGCADGYRLDRLVDIYRCKASGCDISDVAIETGKTKYPAVDLQVCDMVKVPYRDGQFELVIARGVLMYLPHKQLVKALSEMIRVSSKYILIRDWFADTPFKTEFGFSPGKYIYHHNIPALIESMASITILDSEYINPDDISSMKFCALWEKN